MMHLQSALFGGVYEAKGRSSGKDYAIKAGEREVSSWLRRAGQ